MSQAKGKDNVPVEQSFLKQAGAPRLLRPFTNPETIRSLRKPRIFPVKPAVNSHDRNSCTWDGVFQQANKNNRANSTISSTICSGLPNELGDFQQFDPIRTLQFLIGELKTKIKLHMPDNEAVLKIVSEMKNTVKRVSNADGIKVNIFETQEDRSRRLYTATGRGEQLIPVNEDEALTTTTGTTTLLQNMEKYYTHPAIDNLRHMTENYKKLQEDYRNLDISSSTLRDEKCKIQKELSLCQDEIICLNKKISRLEDSHKEVLNKKSTTIGDLQEQCKRLQSKVEVYKENASSSTSAHQQQNTEIVLVEELNSKLKKSFHKIATLKRSRLESSKQFVSTVLEKEKLSIQLSCRETQINEIENELQKIHALVTEQMKTLTMNLQHDKLPTSQEESPEHT